MIDKRKLLIAGSSLVAVVLVVAGIMWYRSSILLLQSTTPSNGEEASVTTQVEYVFNHPIDPAVSDNFSINPHVPGRVVVKDNKVVFEPSENLQIDTAYHAVLENPQSVDGLKADSVEVEFTAVYIPYSGLSPEQRAEETQQSVNLQEAYPITEHLPHETLEYKIDYTVPNFAAAEPETSNSNNQDPSTDNEKQPLILDIELYAILNRPEQYDRYQRQLRQYKKRALDYIRSLGFEPKDYDIRYTPELDN